MRQKNGCDDEFLAKRLAKVDLWLEEGRIPTSSKVIPIHESLKTQQWVLPTEKGVEILRNSKSFVLTECLCRSHYKRCNNPLDVCFIRCVYSTNTWYCFRLRRIVLDFVLCLYSKVPSREIHSDHQCKGSIPSSISRCTREYALL